MPIREAKLKAGLFFATIEMVMCGWSIDQLFCLVSNTLVYTLASQQLFYYTFCLMQIVTYN